jgi:hypothetical protein
MNKKTILLLAIPVLIAFGVLMSVNTVLETIFKNQVRSFNKVSRFQITYDDFSVSAISGSADLQGFEIHPKIRDKGKRPHFYTGKVKLIDLDVLEMLIEKRLDIKRFEIDDLSIVFLPFDLEPSKEDGSEAVQKEDEFKSLKLDEFVIKSFKVIVADSSVTDTVSYLRGGQFRLTNINIEQDANDQLNYLDKSEKMQLIMNDQRLEMVKEGAQLGFKQFLFDFNNKTLLVDNLEVKTLPDIETAMRQTHYTKTFIDATVKQVAAYGYNLARPGDYSEWTLDSLLFQSPRLTLVKDQLKPFDEQKRIPLPPDILQGDSSVYSIEKIRVQDGQLSYTEKYELGNMIVPISKFHLTVSNVRTRYDEGANKELVVHLVSEVFDGLPMEFNLRYKDPLNSQSFEFWGHTGSTSMTTFSPVLRHTIGARITDGRLDRLSFNGWGNEYVAGGQLTMLYHDLETELLKEDERERNKFLSFLSNQFVKKSNPVRGRTKVAKMSFERVLYKGFGNFLFKTIESGILNTFNPVGGKVK